MIAAFDPELDLLFERVVPTPRRLVWRAWTEPKTLVKWFCPRPWEAVGCEMDLRPGGRFATVMRSPEGVEVAGANCYLLVEPERRLVWTSALTPGFRPHAQPTSDAPTSSSPPTCILPMKQAVRFIGHTSCTPRPRRADGMKTWVFTTAGPPLSTSLWRPWPAKFDGECRQRSEPARFHWCSGRGSLASPSHPPYLKATSAGRGSSCTPPS